MIFSLHIFYVHKRAERIDTYTKRERDSQALVVSLAHIPRSD